ncbi:MAG TPA: hypothetical protein PLD20_33250 [Blastocatellia bacterium]|nr:hypothetical protein [Blastocatellia bacterium]HMV87980.1 hypothetical protein [Blastocatellia bacterium]HMX30308.1 hypothetical protein [Blastocatellia bacterium]HMY74251.1 hypothetical protein [Blastocatellia bacterium]HMZ22840.1 hypothetical protein [Blastocatellia bacterium]
MKTISIRRFSALALAALLMMAVSAVAQTTRTRPTVTSNDPATYRYAYQHGYRGGYEDGFTKGKSDFNDNQVREFANSEAYNRADRGYQQRMGTLPEFQEGYRIGFELGYNDGYLGRPFTTSMPANLGRVVVASVNASVEPAPVENTRPRTTDDRRAGDDRRASDDRYNSEPASRTSDRASSNSRPPSTSSGSGSRGTVTIPDGVSMKVRLNDQLNTRTNKEGDRFTAVVLDPSDYADAIIEGHIAKLNKSGKASGKTELALAFDTIRLRDGRSGRMAAQVEKIYESEKVKSVDEEGNVETSSRTKDTATRGAGGAALGAIIGGIAGGGKGAAIGAAIGGGLGVGSVFIEGGKELVLEPGTEMLLRTAAPARTRD